MMVDEASGEDRGDAQAALDALRDYGVVQLSPAGEVLQASAGAEALLGYPPHELAGLAFEDLFAAARGGPGLLSRLRRALRDDGVFRDEAPGAARNRWIAVEAYPVDPADPAGGMVAICRDATAERQRRAADERLRLLTEAVHDYAVCLLSPGGVITDWNVGAA